MSQRSFQLRLALFVAFGLLPSISSAINFLSPNDPIIAIDTDGGTQAVPPANEGVANLFDNKFTMPVAGSPNPAVDGTKYLNFGGAGSGVIVTPQPGTIVQGLTYYTANDAMDRDPTSYSLWGTNDSITSVANGRGNNENWTLISAGALAPPTERYAAGEIVNFANSTSYSSYRVLFPTIRTATSIFQLGELSLLDGGGVDVTDPSNSAIAIDYIPPGTSASPAGEDVAKAIDRNVNTKYLNSGARAGSGGTNGRNSGFIVTPAAGATVVNGFRITTANDLPGRDPSSYKLYGTNDAITSVNHSVGDAENWTLIDEGTLELPEGRFTPSSIIPVDNLGGTSYTSYRMVFPTIKAVTNLPMQIAEVELFEADDAKLVVNRTTGTVSIQAVQNVTFGSYEIASGSFGSLKPGSWTPISSNNSADPDGSWDVTGTSSNGLLAETDTGAGLSLLAGQSYVLGNIFQLTPYDDLRFELFAPGGQLLSETVEFTGAPITFGDFNRSGSIDISDYPTLVAGMGGKWSGLSLAESYLKGDMDGDLDTDINDFILFVDAAGGYPALFGTAVQVPEPSSVLLLALPLAALALRRKIRLAMSLSALALFLGAEGVTQAQTYTSLGVATVTTPDTVENAQSTPVNLFDDEFLDLGGGASIDTELFYFNYNNPDPEINVGLQYAGLGGTPKRLFFNYGSPVTTNSFAFAQRAGALPRADRVGTFEFWFSDTDFGSTLPERPADSVTRLDPDDPRLLDSYLRPYALQQEFTAQYMAMRITMSEVSVGQAATNIGGNEFRFMYGTSPIVLEIDRSTGAMSLHNDEPNAAGLTMKAYEIESPMGGLVGSAFNGLGGDVPAFPDGNGTGFNGWDTGASNSAYHLTELNFSSTSVLAAGINNLSLGAAYNSSADTGDVLFRWTNELGHVFDGVVRYVGTAPENDPGDFNADGIVNLADYTVWRDNLGGDASAINFNGSGGATITAADYGVWKSNFGTNYGALSGLAGSSVVPEPATLALCTLALAAACVARRACALA
jgi:hypothetical protein